MTLAQEQFMSAKNDRIPEHYLRLGVAPLATSTRLERSRLGSISGRGAK